MRSGGAYHRVKFFIKQSTRDAYGSSSDTWDYNNPLITTHGEIRYTGGAKSLNNDERFFSKNIELIVRYRSTITETMRIQIDITNDLWMITYIEIQGRNESLRLTIEKCLESLPGVIAPPTSFSAVLDSGVDIDLSWKNNTSKDGVIIERSENGNIFEEIVRIAKSILPAPEIVSYKDEGLKEETQYFYRAKSFEYYSYSAYTSVVYATTETEN